MGCCMSSNANSKRHPSPPQPSEEETVKEVVTSETPPPLPKPTFAPLSPIFHRPKTLILQEPPKPQTPLFQDQKDEIFEAKEEETKLPAAEVFQGHRIQQQPEILYKQKQYERETERTPQVSETYSNADTYSTATTNTTTTITEIRDDNTEVTSKRRIVSRSPSKLPRKRPYNPERDRLSKRQPVKREYSGQSRTTSTSTQCGNVGSSRVGRDAGERSIRRSRSPATRGPAGGGVKGRAGISPATVAGKSGGGSGRVEESEGLKKEEKSENHSVSKMQEQGQQQQPEGNESLENPLVSLECFIFL